MEIEFTIITQNRKLLYQYLKNLPKDELFKIPERFNNNIWWNIAHVVVTQQLLVYGLSGQPLQISETLVSKYQKGTVPESKPSNLEVEEITSLLFSLPEQTKTAYEQGTFKNFKPYMTTPKVELKSVEDAIAFNNFHEGLHLGSIMALTRAVKKQQA